jgi:hypothetical protein
MLSPGAGFQIIIIISNEQVILEQYEAAQFIQQF